MAKIVVRYGALLAEIAGTREVEVVLPGQECTMKDLLGKLASTAPRGLARELLDGKTGEPACLVTVNGRLVPPALRSGFVLNDGDRVTLIPAVSGGIAQHPRDLP